MQENTIVLCGANSYNQKYFFNPEFSGLPQQVQQELKILCVMFTEDIGGILTLTFRNDGTLLLNIDHDDHDYLFDEIGSEMKIREIQKEKEPLLRSLECYFRVVFLGEEDDGMPETAEDERSDAAGEGASSRGGQP